MNAYEFLKNKSFEDVVKLGCKYATKKQEFQTFANKFKEVGDGDYVRAVVATAQMLNEEYTKVHHDLHMLEFVYGGDGNLKNPISEYFDDENASLTKEFDVCLKEYDEMIVLYNEYQKIKYSKFNPLIKSTNFYKLMNYKNKTVIITAVKNENKEIKKGVFKLRIFGNNPQTMKVKMGTNVVPLVGIEKGVVSIHDPNSLDMIYQNHYVDSDRYSQIQKTAYIYGVEKAREYYADRIKEVQSRVQDKPSCLLQEDFEEEANALN